MYEENDFYHDGNGNYEFETTRMQLWLYMLTFGFPESLTQKTDVYNNCACAAAVRLYDGFVFDSDRMEQTINYLYETNDALRTVFSVKENKLVQKVLLEYKYTLDVRETKGKTTEERYADAVRQVNEEAALPLVSFDKIQNKFVLFKIEENDYVILTVQNHMLSDGNSVYITLKKLMRYYEGSMVHESGGTYLDFTQNQINLLKTETGQAKLEQFRKEMEDFVYTPNFKPNPEDCNIISSQLGVVKADAKKLKELSRKNKTTLFYYVLTAFHLGLSVGLDTNDTAIMCGTANRNEGRFVNTIGMITRTLTHRLKLEDSESLEELLKRVTKKFMQLLEDQVYASYDMKSPFLVTMHSGSAVGGILKLKNGTSKLVELEPDRRVEMFCMVGGEFGDELILNAQCESGIYGREFILKVTGVMDKAFEMMILHPEMTTGDFLRMFKE